MKTSGIYAIQHLATGRQYVGSSVSVEDRWLRHKRDLRKGLHHSAFLQRAWDKYGPDAFGFVILETCASPDLLAREQLFLDTLRPAFNEAKIAGNCLGVKHGPMPAERRAKIALAQRGVSKPSSRRPKSAETRERMAEAARKRSTPEYRARIAATLKGHAVSDVTRARISESVKARLAA
jgi:group I intron endonuclease